MSHRASRFIDRKRKGPLVAHLSFMKYNYCFFVSSGGKTFIRTQQRLRTLWAHKQLQNRPLGHLDTKTWSISAKHQVEHSNCTRQWHYAALVIQYRDHVPQKHFLERLRMNGRTHGHETWSIINKTGTIYSLPPNMSMLHLDIVMITEWLTIIISSIKNHHVFIMADSITNLSIVLYRKIYDKSGSVWSVMKIHAVVGSNFVFTPNCNRRRPANQIRHFHQKINISQPMEAKLFFMKFKWI